MVHLTTYVAGAPVTMLDAPSLEELQTRVLAWCAHHGVTTERWPAGGVAVMRAVPIRNRMSRRTHMGASLVGYMQHDGRVWTDNSVTVLAAPTPASDDACRVCRDQCECHATSTVCGLCQRTTNEGVTT